METPKKLLIFSQKKTFLTFRATKTPKQLFIFPTLKKFLIFREMELSYILGNGISADNLQSLKIKILFLIKKQNFSN